MLSGLNQEQIANFNSNCQLWMLRSLYGYKGHVLEEKNNIVTLDGKDFRNMMENATEPINPDNVIHMSAEEERRLRSNGNSELLIQALKRAGELGILDPNGHQKSPVVQRINRNINQSLGYKAYGL
ncbi:hypothetical protein [Thermaerobacillus caldiproteolyticus]|uniref:hypothetical protein n=1 Tax=Thermaerobacillus caldiproteolyticus TaxID=247480 RepID=UPI00188CFE53|nr:hypothetical protein [Anoxybacillus caldiproteolyticus]QPA31635.1 hypothetical protein ISX45_01025 [Anoxybacillus caldiproteolyticus]